MVVASNDVGLGGKWKVVRRSSMLAGWRAAVPAAAAAEFRHVRRVSCRHGHSAQPLDTVGGRGERLRLSVSRSEPRTARDAQISTGAQKAEQGTRPMNGCHSWPAREWCILCLAVVTYVVDIV